MSVFELADTVRCAPSNRSFDLRCVDLKAALTVACTGPVAGYRVHSIDGVPTLALLSGGGADAVMFPAPLDAVSLEPIVAAWLGSVEHPKRPSIDGGTGRSVRVFTGPTWSHVEQLGWDAMFAVQPWWAVWGK